ncbi:MULTISPECIES: DUF397 domain-containing protein [Amycolatopsis]|uniref:DUF397 domain-containing protein n=2 Tax=Amycolatopsis TaxID=1813 RepID=A0A229S4Z6_9PSEU|nr:MULTISPECIES: DUF397 domain-containing protein [Amycolatopsis]AXB41317.1 hypothetical protein A4R43_01270 [Amycolatopsis albispora]OXM53789.1 hypothetical protein CFP71_21495 [Amycolatopsis thailandensis]
MSTATPSPFREDDFRKASASQPDKDCVRVARRGARVELRNDTVPFGSADDLRLVFDAADWDAFLETYRATGSAAGTCLEVVRRHDGLHVFRAAVASDVELVFTESEADKFWLGVRHYEFDAAAFAA